MQEGKHCVHLPVGDHIQDQRHAYCIHRIYVLHILEGQSKAQGPLQWLKLGRWNVNQFLKIHPYCQKDIWLSEMSGSLFSKNTKKKSQKSLSPLDGNIFPAYLLRSWDKWN